MAEVLNTTKQVVRSNTNLDMCKFLTLSPISKDVKKKGNIDYNEQLERNKLHNLMWCWDDSKNNNARQNEYFGFMFYGKKVIIHKITAVRDPTHRLPSWSVNVGQTNRNVLELSEPLREISWEEWLLINGPLAKQGTYRAKDLPKDRPMLYELLREL